MNQFANLVVTGLSLGLVYGLIALGLSVIFRATRMLNFAHAPVVMLGAYLIAELRERLGFAAAVLLAALLCALFSVAISVLLSRRIGKDMRLLEVATLGLNVVIVTEVSRRIGVDVLPIGDPWGDRVVRFAGLALPAARVSASVIVLAVLVGFFLAFRYSNWGFAMKATSEDAETAALMGIRLRWQAAAAWALAGAFAVLAGLFLTTFPSAGVDPTLAGTALLALPAFVIGGADSPGGVVCGGLILGVAETLSAGYQQSLSFLGGSFHTVLPYLLLLVVLAVRPAGLFGSQEVTRV